MIQTEFLSGVLNFKIGLCASFLGFCEFAERQI